MYIELFRQFLKEQDLFDYRNSNKWYSFKIKNQIKDRQKLKQDITDIKKEMDSNAFLKGLYLIENKDGNVLYIGKGINKKNGVIDRIESHLEKACIESYRPKTKRQKRLVELLQNNRGDLTIYVTNVEDDREAIVLEEMLTLIFEPTYIKMLHQ